MNRESTYQLNYSLAHQEQYDSRGRAQKAKKTIAVLSHFLPQIKQLDALEMGCSAGNLASIYVEHFRTFTGIDIDEAAIEYAQKHFESPGLTFHLEDAMNTRFADASFDVVICSHVYEHVPSAEKLMAEIYRVLRPGGICYFAAGNRLIWNEPDNRLPLLSVMPRWLAQIYFRSAGRGKHYYEKFYSVWGLRRLVKAFHVVDYTRSVIQNPTRFEATDMFTEGSFKHKAALFASRWLYWIFPTYLWLLVKKK